jgi:hypothetical protein
VTKVEAASQEAISGLKGKIILTPTRLLSAEDELFRPSPGAWNCPAWRCDGRGAKATADRLYDRIKSRIPRLSMTLPPKRDVWGNVITSEGGLGPDIMSPVRISTARNDPVAAELLRLEAGIGAVPRKVTGRQLSPMEYSQYQEVAGKLLRQDLVERIAGSEWAMTRPQSFIQRQPETDRCCRA